MPRTPTTKSDVADIFQILRHVGKIGRAQSPAPNWGANGESPTASPCVDDEASANRIIGYLRADITAYARRYIDSMRRADSESTIDPPIRAARRYGYRLCRRLLRDLGVSFDLGAVLAMAELIPAHRAEWIYVRVRLGTIRNPADASAAPSKHLARRRGIRLHGQMAPPGHSNRSYRHSRSSTIGGSSDTYGADTITGNRILPRLYSAR